MAFTSGSTSGGGLDGITGTSDALAASASSAFVDEAPFAGAVVAAVAGDSDPWEGALTTVAAGLGRRRIGSWVATGAGGSGAVAADGATGATGGAGGSTGTEIASATVV